MAVPILLVGFFTAVHGQWIQTSNGFGTNRLVGSMASSNGWVYAGVFIPLGDTTNVDGVYRSSDNGLSWAAPDPIDGCSLEPYDLYASGANVYAATSYFLWASTNSGASFSTPGNGNSTAVVNVVPCMGNIVSNALYGIYQSYNAYPWDIIPNPLDSTTIADLASNGTTLAATFNKTNYQQGRVRISSDCGSTWQDVLMLNGEWFQSLSVSGNTILAKSNVSDIHLSTDMGSSWTTITGINGSGVTSAVVEGAYVFATTNDRIFVSFNHCQSWTDISAGFNPVGADFASITIHDGYVFMGTTFFSVWRRPLSEITAVETGSHIDFTLYPNPVQDEINLAFQDGDSFHGTFRICSPTGQDLLSGELSVTSGLGKINVAGLTTGMYFLTLENDRGVTAQHKILVVD